MAILIIVLVTKWLLFLQSTKVQFYLFSDFDKKPLVALVPSYMDLFSCVFDYVNYNMLGCPEEVRITLPV